MTTTKQKRKFARLQGPAPKPVLSLALFHPKSNVIKYFQMFKLHFSLVLRHGVKGLHHAKKEKVVWRALLLLLLVST